MNFATEKKESENNNNNNPENAHHIVDYLSQFSSDLNNNKEAEERQARELKAVLHSLKAGGVETHQTSMPSNLASLLYAPLTLFKQQNAITKNTPRPNRNELDEDKFVLNVDKEKMEKFVPDVV